MVCMFNDLYSLEPHVRESVGMLSCLIHIVGPLSNSLNISGLVSLINVKLKIFLVLLT